ncbi:MBL fold metallo-hydrolase [uncultured Paenibacillus sp.]|uniref:MBL fold metallo-hydrolase n=1 Tax=uncultured Paenibacillus sp. TaxID=227322 RepID=UPI0028D2C591|nr:MBL fold metallo-hydrolase [uncultured Paenibacillus sp.]
MKSAAEQDELTMLDGGWARLKVPLPFSLRYVNAYLIPDAADGGYTLIDPGLHTAAAEGAWERAVNRLGITYDGIQRIVLTHMHPDHYGLAGWFQQKSGAPVLMSRASHAYAKRLWGEGRTFAAELTALYGKHGMPAELLGEIGPHLESFVALVSPQPEVTYIAEGDRLAFGGGEWTAIGTEGHGECHLCFYRPDARLMLCGDQVLPDITPNVSVVPGSGGGELRRFLASLDRLEAYDVAAAFPGHRDPFADFAGRIRELKEHHARRLDMLAGWLDRPIAAYDLCVRMFGERVGGNIHNLRFAMSETLAHLDHLVDEGRAERVRQGDRLQYKRR